jgi:CO/xanthine dehydrogenase Mo-binding subunit/aerobic-type carbon monoxide dehydrogenase small subunit (CoxS/CutS family)
MSESTISFYLNGRAVSSHSDPSMSLLAYIRDVAGLKGTKKGCGSGHCGSCTVLVDGKPIRSCTKKLSTLAGKSVLTIESLKQENGVLHPIQAAFLEAGAVQCGFCTPAMVLTAKALLDNNHHPSKAEIEKAFSHSYCRCTGYVKIIKAVLLASQKLYPEQVVASDEVAMLEQTEILDERGNACTKSDFQHLGGSCQDWDGREKVSGSLKFADDLVMPAMVYAQPVFTSIPHARIRSIDTSEALGCDAVITVLTAKDVPGLNGFGMVVADQRVLCEGEVNYIGDVLAVVVARTQAAAMRGAEAVQIDLEELPGVYDFSDPVASSNLIREINYGQGDLEQVKAEPDLLVLRGDFSTTWVEHAYMEPESVLAYPQDGKLVVMTPTQAPFELRKQIAGVLNLPLEDVRIIVTPLGGGFGGKGDATIQPLAALAAHLLKRPVKITLSREESLNMSTKKHPYHLQYEIGLNREGILRYVDAEILSDGGPYANLSPRVIDQSCIFAVGPYRIAAGRVRGRCVRTNNVLSSAMRGFGINQVSYAMEVLLDQASHKLRIDPFVLRERNAFASGDKTFSGEILYDSVGTLATLRACQERLRRVEEPYRKVYPKGTKSLGIGMATCFKNVGAGKGRVDNAGATITRTRKGTFLLEVSGVDMGQGFRTAMVQLASETLSVPMSAISVVNGDTDRTAIHGSAVGERQTLVSGMAVVKACQLLQEKICIADAQEVVSVHYDHQAPRTFSLGDDEGRASVPPEQYKNYPAYAYATQAVVLEVDRQTGQVNVLEVVAAHDTGRVLNQTVLEGQIEGCCSMGIGYALSEQFRVARGQAQTKYYGQLGVPTIKQTPNYHILLIEDPEPSGPYGAKGISEVGTVPMTAAIINAIADAVGVYITSLPATPQAILTALQEAENITL